MLTIPSQPTGIAQFAVTVNLGACGGSNTFAAFDHPDSGQSNAPVNSGGAWNQTLVVQQESLPTTISVSYYDAPESNPNRNFIAQCDLTLELGD